MNEMNHLPEISVMDNWLNSDILAVIRHRKKEYIRLKYETYSANEKIEQDKEQKIANLEAYIQFLQNLLNKSGDIIIAISDLFEKSEDKKDE